MPDTVGLTRSEKRVGTFRDLPLQRKLLILVGLAVFVSFVVAALSLAWYDVGVQRPRELIEVRNEARSVAQVVAGPLASGDRHEAGNLLRAVGSQPQVRALLLRDANNAVVAEYVRSGSAPVPFPMKAGEEHLESTPEVLIASEPVVVSGKWIGTAWAANDLRPLGARLLFEYAVLLGGAALSLLALTVMLSVTIRRTISEPVQALVSAARNVTRTRDYSLRVNTPRRDEMGQLAHELNAMLAAMEEREQAPRRSEATARQQVNEIESLYENAEVGLCHLDCDLRLVRLNKRFARINARTVEDSVGRTLAEAAPNLAGTLTPAAQRTLDSGETLRSVEVQGLVADSPDVHFWIVRLHPLRNSAGTVTGVHLAVLDITERKRVEEERADLEAQLRQSQKMQALGTLAGGIAHDFNNVLTAISGNTRLALEDLPPDHPAVVSLREIERGAGRAKDLVRRILAFSRQEQSDRRLIDLRPIVDEALRLLRATVPTMIDIRAETTPNLPAVLADATQVHQVVMNLGTNACDAMQSQGGTLTVRLSCVTTDSRMQAISPDLKPGRYLRITMEDTGVGIGQDVLERVFEPFFTTKPPGKGTGLGLSVVHGIMRGHHGAVLARSERGKGSTFDLYFPASDEVSDPEALASRADAGPAGHGEHILYVDDEEALVFLVTRMMQRMGYRITGFTHASQAIDAVRTDPRSFDLVISDLGMPGMSGMELAAELLHIRPDLPVIITSGYVRAEDARRAEEIGVRDIVLKPGTVAEMGRLIQERLHDATRTTLFNSQRR